MRRAPALSVEQTPFVAAAVAERVLQALRPAKGRAAAEQAPARSQLSAGAVSPARPQAAVSRVQVQRPWVPVEAASPQQVVASPRLSVQEAEQAAA